MNPLLLHPSWLLPIHPATVLHEHSLLISEGKIADIGPRRELTERYPEAEVCELDGHVVLPGLVNAHTHSPMTLLRGFADDLPLMEWLQDYIWPTEAAHMGTAFVTVGSRLAFAEMLRSGTTCFNDMYFFPEVTARVALDVGIRASIGLIVLDFSSAWAHDSAEYLRKGLELREFCAEYPLLTNTLAPHAPYTVSDGPLAQIAELSAQYQLPVHIHVHETEQEIANSIEATGQRPLARLAKLGLLNEHLMAVHMTQLLDDEIAQLAAAKVSVLHCPESNLKLASGFCPTAKLLKSGVNLAIGTDGCASNNDLDMWGELRTAALLAKGVSGEASAMPAMVALECATLNGAKALGLGDQIGSLEVGKCADVIAVDLRELETQPYYDLASALAYAVNCRQVKQVWIAGKWVLRNGELTTLDITALHEEAQMWAAKIKP